MLDLSKAHYLISAHRLEQCPLLAGAEVVFAGRSNVGKSTALNTIVNRKGLARASKTPGRTQQIIFFAISENHRLVDLPGYGYAKVVSNLQAHWQTELPRFFAKRSCLRGLILLLDSRRPLLELDQQMLSLALNCRLPVHILLTKADKLNKSQQQQTLKSVRGGFLAKDLISCQLFSAHTRQGLEEARDLIQKWFADQSAGNTDL